jgi:predicted RNA-binding protein with RPS1 domain
VAQVESSMTETLENVETQAPSPEPEPRPEPEARRAPASPLEAALAEWSETPPASVSAALTERGLGVEALEEFIRSGPDAAQVEGLRRILVQGASSGNAEDASLLARLTPLLDPRERSWDRVMKAKNSGEILTAPVTEAVKGGVVVDLGVRGFVPSSQLGLSVPKNLQQYVGQTLRVRVLEVDRRRQTVIVSNRQVVEEERKDKRRSAMERLEEGQVREGVVRRLTDIGAFVDVGGIDGLLHVSEISWKRVDHPKDVLKVGQKVQVKILKLDPATQRISLSMRRLMSDPWEEARKKYQIGSIVKVKIAKTVAQGAVVELEEALEGFIPISELATRRIATPEEVVQPGQEVEALVIDLRPRERRVVFSLRKLEQKKDRQVVDAYQKKARSTSERTTLGDLFGHLFEEYQPPEEEKPAEVPAAAATTAADESGATAGAAIETEASGEAAATAAADATTAISDEPAIGDTPADAAAIGDAGEPATIEATADAAPADTFDGEAGEPTSEASAFGTDETDESAPDEANGAGDSEVADQPVGASEES